MGKQALDKDLKKVGSLEQATYTLSRSIAAPGLAILFLITTFIFVSDYVPVGPFSLFVIIGGVIAGYMALNIGANDVANNMGPAVGSRALPLWAALLIAAICEAAGTILAGGDVVKTIAHDIVAPSPDLPLQDFVFLMLSASFATGVWLHLATFLRAPVSTTHSIVGGVLGAGLAAGAGSVQWGMIATIAASWVISPLMGGVLAALLLAFIKWKVLFQGDKLSAARRWVPILNGVMLGTFAMYLAMKGFSKIWSPDFVTVLICGAIFFMVGYGFTKPWVARKTLHLENRRKHVAGLFSAPLVIAAAFLSFAHGANDVSNAVGPLAAIVNAVQDGSTTGGSMEQPLWILVIGAIGIALGLALFGPRLIRTVGTMITKMDAPRAYCVALSAAGTVLLASTLGLPVSSTHIAIGGIFGVGFLREQLANLGLRANGERPAKVKANVPSSLNKTPEEAIRKQQKREKRRLVRRRHVLGIAAAWCITVPATGIIAACFYFTMKAFH